MLTTLTLLAALAGCSDSTSKSTDTGPDLSGNQEPDIMEVCDSEQTSFARDQGLPLGFTAADLMAGLVGTTGLTGHYPEGTTTDVDVTILDGEGPVVFTERFVTGTDTKDFVCFDVVTVPITLVVTSSDEAFNFDLSASLNAAATDSFTVTAEAQVSDNRGSHSIEVEENETATYRILQMVSAEDVQGSIEERIEGVSGDVAFAGQGTLISWPEGG